MSFKLSSPSASSGDRWSKDQHLDHLHLFVGPIGRREDVETSFGISTAAHAPHILCAQCLEVWSDQLVFGAALEPRLTGEPDAEVIVGRLGQGLAKPGRSAPWVLDDPTEADLEQAEAVLDKYATRLPSGTIVLDTKALAENRPDPESF